MEEMPSATSYSPRSLGRVKLLSSDEVNILQGNEPYMDAVEDAVQ